jgi:catechol 2,3-dioxygenase-like lactoylglutathione lyase family enzyme
VIHGRDRTPTGLRVAPVDMNIALIVLPVSDVDRAKAFYRSVGFREDLDYASGRDFRIVRFTPPGSTTSFAFGVGITSATPGSVEGLHLRVPDIDAARSMLIGRNIEVGEVFHDLGGVFHRVSPWCDVPGRDPARRNFASFARFSDPDGNGWVLAERSDEPLHPA